MQAFSLGSSFAFLILQDVLMCIELGENISTMTAHQRMVGYVETYSKYCVCSQWSHSVDELTGREYIRQYSLKWSILYADDRLHHSSCARVSNSGVFERGEFIVMFCLFLHEYWLVWGTLFFAVLLCASWSLGKEKLLWSWRACKSVKRWVNFSRLWNKKVIQLTDSKNEMFHPRYFPFTLHARSCL